MKIGIQYCGGCNPRYDRVKVVEMLQDRFSGVEWSYVDPDKTYDLIVEVTGCGKECIPRKRIAEQADSLVFINSREDLCAAEAVIAAALLHV